MKVVVVGTNQKDRERVAKAIKDKYGSLTEENAALLKKLQRSNDAWVRGREEIASLERDKEILRNMGKTLKDSIVALAADRDRLREEMPCRRCGIRKYGYCEECKTLRDEEVKE